jgi:4-fold beta flower protein
MRNDLYTESGLPLGFRDGNFIYDLHGRFVGQLHGSQVYCMAGHYVGELEDGVIHIGPLNPPRFLCTNSTWRPPAQSAGKKRSGCRKANGSL